jgi:hypothetical protein
MNVKREIVRAAAVLSVTWEKLAQCRILGIVA